MLVDLLHELVVLRVGLEARHHTLLEHLLVRGLENVRLRLIESTHLVVASDNTSDTVRIVHEVLRDEALAGLRIDGERLALVVVRERVEENKRVVEECSGREKNVVCILNLVKLRGHVLHVRLKDALMVLVLHANVFKELEQVVLVQVVDRAVLADAVLLAHNEDVLIVLAQANVKKVADELLERLTDVKLEVVIIRITDAEPGLLVLHTPWHHEGLVQLSLLLGELDQLGVVLVVQVKTACSTSNKDDVASRVPDTDAADR